MEGIQTSLVSLEYWPALCTIQKDRNYTGSVEHALRSQGDVVVVKDALQGTKRTGGICKTPINFQTNSGVR